jgi:hypothetical protein
MLRGARRFRALLACALALTARTALADGAFPDSQNILAPADRPHSIWLATNFGLVLSEDDGQTWTWSCEQSGNSFGMFYQLGASPTDRMYTVSLRRVGFSDDVACSWQVATGLLDSMEVIDAFADPSATGHVMAVALPKGDARGNNTVVESTDGGATFTSVLYTAAASTDSVTGIEIARADPKTMYLTMTTLAGDAGTSTFARKLVRSRDGGATWTVQDLTPALGPGSIALLAVDRTNPLRVFLRINDGSTGERLAITDDGGVSAHTALQLSGGIMQAFVRASTGTILVAAIVGLSNVLYRSRDGAVTFQQLTATPNFRGLAERNGIFFGAADNVRDPFAVGFSTDEGTTWRPLMHYAQIQAIDGCVKTQCQAACQKQAGAGLWPAAVCGATPSPLPPRDLGSPASDARDAGPSDATSKGPSPGGCHCGTPGRPEPWKGLLAIPAAVAWRRRGRRGNRGQRAPKER